MGLAVKMSSIVEAVPTPALELEQFKMYLSPHQSQFRLEFIPSREYASNTTHADLMKIASA
jgi:hypothetical protein